MKSSSSKPSGPGRLDASLGRYAVAAGAALSAGLTADAAITNLTTDNLVPSNGYTMPYWTSSGAFYLNDSGSGIDLIFNGSRTFFHSAGTPGHFSSSPGFTSFTTTASGATNSHYHPGFFNSTPGLPGYSSRFGVIIAQGTNTKFLKLNLGDSVTGFGVAGALTLFSTSNGVGYGPFNPVAGGNLQGYLGFSAAVGGNNFVGWLRVSLGRDADGGPLSFEFVSGPGGEIGAFAPASEGIAVGASAIPESAGAAAGLGLLALGAAGLRRRRALSAGRN